MPAINYAKLRLDADREIKRFGGPAILTSAQSGDRWCWAVITEYKPMELVGRALNPIPRRALVSVFLRTTTSPDEPVGALILPEPSALTDRLTTLSSDLVAQETLRIRAPVGRLGPANFILYWDLEVIL
jgi:hypothetical protein